MKFIHLSDLHIHTHCNDNKDIAMRLDFISKEYPEHKLIITGDIADDGKVEQFDNAYNLLEPFIGNIFICPGNHDFGAAGMFYSEERAADFDGLLSEPLKQGGTFTGNVTPVVNIVKEDGIKTMFIALDSNLETHTPFDFACGEIGDYQLRNLNTILSGNTDMTKILFFHHHPLMHTDPFMELKDVKKLIETIYGKVDIVLFGHKHEMKQWKNMWGVKYILASDNSSDKTYAKEITIDKDGISINEISITL